MNTINWTKFATQIEYPDRLPAPNYLTVMGSQAYGLATENSDYDFYGFVVPPLADVFPHTRGEILGFGRNINRFEQAQAQHKMTDYGETDSTIYNIVKYFQLLMNGNPNVIDSIFTPIDCIVTSDSTGTMLLEKASIFLSQKCWHTFRGMAHSHIARLETRQRVGKRKDVIDEYGYDTKDASHVIRIVKELGQILFTGNLNLRDEETITTVKEIRAGTWSRGAVNLYFQLLMDSYEADKYKWVVPYAPDEKAIRQLLINCLENEYGSLERIGFVP